MRDGRIEVRLRCREGCNANAFGGRFVQGAKAFSFGRGSHVLRLPVELGRQRSLLLRFDLSVRNGPPRRASIRVRR